MKNKVFSSVMIFAFLIFALITLGGCGGSSSGSIDGGSTSARYALLGSLDDDALSASELAPYIKKIINKEIDPTSAEDIELLENLTSKDFLFITNLSDLDAKATIDDPFTWAFVDAFISGATIVAVYPDSSDVAFLSEACHLNLGAPKDDSTIPRYELLAVSRRDLSGDITFYFSYIDNCDANLKDAGELDNAPTQRVKYSSTNSDGSYVLVEDTSPVIGDNYTASASIPSDDKSVKNTLIETNPILSTDAELDSALAKNRAQGLDEYKQGRIDALLEWAAGIDEEARNMEVSAAENAAKLRAAAAQDVWGAADRTDELKGFVTGMDTVQYDNYYKSFPDYVAEYYKKENDTFYEFCNKSDLDSESRRKSVYGNFKVSRTTYTKYRTYSFHSFENKNDYYLVEANTATTPNGIQVRAYAGSTTGGELAGMCSYHYAMVLGATAALETSIYPAAGSGSDNVLVKYLPHLPVNKETSYTDTESWSIGGGVGLKGHAEGESSVNTNFDANNEDQGGIDGTKIGVGGELDVSFNWGISHQSTKRWAVSDYEYVPVVGFVYASYNGSDGKTNPKFTCKTVLNEPEYVDNKGWKISNAARYSTIQDMECIWSVPKENADKFKLTGITSWKEGFAWAHEWPVNGSKNSKQNATIEHRGAYTKINLVRPAYIALEGPENGTKAPVVDSGKEGGMCSAIVHSESNWTG